VLQFVALSCSVLQYVDRWAAKCEYSVLQCIAMLQCCSVAVLQCVVVCCSVLTSGLQSVNTVCCSELQCNTLCCSMLQCVAECEYSVLQ